MKIKNQLFKNPILWAFSLNFIYWFYLILTSHMEISCDAFGYEFLGKMLVEKGWPAYLMDGPTREPFYPFLVSLSMRIGGIFSFPYQPIQAFLQFLILFITQLIMLRILRLLKINNWISACAIFYLGVSPAMINSALSLFSEIAAYPLILASILLLSKSWVSFSGPKSRIIIFAVASGLAFALLTLTKAVFEVIAPVFLTLFFLSTLFTRNRRFILNALIFLFIALFLFYAIISGYKLANKIFNGNFVITNRAGVMFYGGIARRAEPLTRERFLTGLAYIPGEGVCEAIFGKTKCYFWSNAKSDEFGFTKLGEVTATGLRPEEVDREISRAAFKKILQNPAQFFLLWFMEGSKIIFWESTQTGFVSYPPGLTRLFSWAPLKNGLRLLLALLTFAGLVYLLSFLLHERKKIFKPQEDAKILLFLSAVFIFLYTSAYALCIVVIRYTFPIASLYLIICAFFIQKIVTKIKQV